VVVIGAAGFDVDDDDEDVPVFFATDAVAVVFLLCVVLLSVLGVVETAVEVVAVVVVVAILVAAATGAITAVAITAVATVVVAVATTGGTESLLVSAGCDASSTCDCPSVILRITIITIDN
jgi:hypothetical protein